MNSKKNQSIFDRCEDLKIFGIGSTAGIMSMFGSSSSARVSEKVTPSYTRGMAPVKLTRVNAIACTPAGSNLIVVRVEISEPGLYGLGWATFTQRAMAVVRAINFALMISVLVRMWILLKQKAAKYPIGSKSN